jgi:uncharacterized protein (DUF1499 family)
MLALVVAGIGLTLARYDVIPKITGFLSMLGGGALASLAVILGIIGIALNLRFRTATLKSAIIALILALPFAGFLVSRPLTTGDVPAIHDITTNLSNPPAFRSLTLRPDNLAGVGTVAEWQRLHTTAYGDLQPLTIAVPPAEVLAKAERLARARGWTIASVDRAAGQIEATDSVSYIRFYDDIAIRVTPGSDGATSIVDMRSVSRIGVSDLGVNARRIRAFLDDLAKD